MAGGLLKVCGAALLAAVMLAGCASRLPPPPASPPLSASRPPAPPSERFAGFYLVGGFAAQDRLWVWTMAGELASYPLSDMRREARFDEGVVAVAREGEEVRVLRRTGRQGAVVTHFRQGAREDGPALQLADGEKPLALSSDEGRPLVATTQALHRLDAQGWRRVDLDARVAELALLGDVSAAAPAAGGAIYLAVNALDLPGRLWRIGLDGRTTDLGEGNFTSLVPDPQQADCVLATLGEGHLFTPGGLVRLCGTVRTRVFEGVRALDPEGEPRRSAEPFFRAALQGEQVWVAGARAIYRQEGERFVTLPLPAVRSLAGVGSLQVSREIPGLLVLSAYMGADESWAGYPPVIVPVD